MNGPALVDGIDSLLPQHQCGRCGYGGCRPYAEAVANGTAKINRCPPGGTLVIEDLSRMLGREALPLDPEAGVIQPATVAQIDPASCIGCTKCLPVCPVDAIVGAPKRLHDIIDAACSGCGLCIEPCPVDCISLVPVESDAEAGDRLDPIRERSELMRRRLRQQATELRARYRRHQARLAETRRRKGRELDAADGRDLDERKQKIVAAVARVRARRSSSN